MADHNPRHHLFDRALRRADWTMRELWLATIALGGKVGVLELEAFLYGLTFLPLDQQDILAVALNERLADLYESTKIPYLTTIDLPGPPAENPLAVIDEHLRTANGTTDRSPTPPPEHGPL